MLGKPKARAGFIVYGDNMYRGYFKVWHKIKDTKAWSRGLEYRGLLITLLEKANTKDKYFAGKIIRRGQFACSMRNLGLEVGVSRSKILRMFGVLMGDDFLTTKADNLFSVVTICNYDVYNPLKSNDRTTSDTTTGQRPDNDRTLLNNDNNDNNDKIDKNSAHELKKIPSWLESRALEVFGNVPLGNLRDLIENYEESWIKEALNKTEAAGVKAVNYTKTILQGWAIDGKTEENNGKCKKDNGTVSETSKFDGHPGA